MIYLLAIGDKSILIGETESFFIKYSMVIGILWLGMTMLSVPFLAVKKIITLDYYNADRYNQIKTTFVLGSFSLPGFIFLSVASFVSGISPIKIYLMDGLILLIYISSGINLIRNKRSD